MYNRELFEIDIAMGLHGYLYSQGREKGAEQEQFVCIIMNKILASLSP